MKASSKCHCKKCNAKLSVIIEDSASNTFTWNGVVAGIEEKAWKELRELHTRQCSKKLKKEKS